MHPWAHPLDTTPTRGIYDSNALSAEVFVISQQLTTCLRKLPSDAKGRRKPSHEFAPPPPSVPSDERGRRRRLHFPKSLSFCAAAMEGRKDGSETHFFLSNIFQETPFSQRSRRRLLSLFPVLLLGSRSHRADKASEKVSQRSSLTSWRSR